MKLPVGNGYYLWILDRCSGGNPAAMAEKAASSGLKWVAIKIANGILPFGNAEQNQAVINAFRAKGISVWGWHYVYGNNPIKEGQIAVRQMLDLTGLDGYIIDAETEFKQAGKVSAARQYMNIIRLGIQQPIGLTSYRFPSLHPDFPWAEFLPRVDFNMPQVFWIGAHNPGYQLRRSYKEFQSLVPNLPFIPLGAAFTQDSWNPTFAELVEFRKTSADLGVPAYGWWEWYFAETRNPMWWDASTRPLGETFPEEPAEPEPVPTVELISTRYNNLNIRSGPSTSNALVGRMVPYRVYDLVSKAGDWGKLGDGVNRWVHLGFTDLVKRVTTKYSNLRVRTGPGFTFPVLGYLPMNEVHRIVQVSGVWGRLEGGDERWVHLQYVINI